MASDAGLKDETATIHLKVSLEGGPAKVETKSVPVPPPIFVDEGRLLELANLESVEARRNTEHGSTNVRLLRFREEGQRQKILEMLRDHFPSIVEECIPLIRDHGRDYRAAVRARAAQTAGELMREFDFIKYKDEIVSFWASSPSLLMSSCVGPALAVAGQDERYAANVKALVRHWLTVSNPMLNWTAMSSCYHLVTLWPDEILDAIEVGLERDLELLVPALFAVQQLCDDEAPRMVKRLAEWANNSDPRSPLRTAGTLIFLEVIEPENIAGDPGLIDYVVDILLVGICDRKLADAGLIRAAMFEKLKEWCLKAFDRPDQEAMIDTLLRRFYLGIEAPRDKERVVWYLHSWARREKKDRFDQLAHTLTEK